MDKKKQICLNMIVKNEAHVIKRCLNSVRNLIDTWVIVDTGSTDGTQDVIKDYFKDIPGNLYERPWVNFGYNRQEALELAKGKSDYVLIIDADDELIIDEYFVLPELEYDAYYIKQKESMENIFREHDVYLLAKNDGSFEWKGVLHEYLQSKTKSKIGFIPNIKNKYNGDGNRSTDENKIKNDIHILKTAIERNDDVPRSLFYLGRTYWSIRAYSSMIKCFEKRINLGGDPMEIYHSLLYIGLAQKKLGYPSEEFIKSLCKAHLYRPTRAESIYELTRYYADTENYFLGYITAKIAIEIPLPEDNLFVESWVYDWGSLLYFFVCANQLGKTQESIWALKMLKNKKDIPEGVRQSFQLEQCYEHLQQMCH